METDVIVSHHITNLKSHNTTTYNDNIDDMNITTNDDMLSPSPQPVISSPGSSTVVNNLSVALSDDEDDAEEARINSKIKDEELTQFTTTDMLGDTNIINSPNNNFISSLDHLPCDIVRSLWIIQGLSLRIESIRYQLKDLVPELLNLRKGLNMNGTNRPIRVVTQGSSKFDKVKSQIIHLKLLSIKYSNELVAESKHLIMKLKDHRSFVFDNLDNMKKLREFKEQEFKDERTWDAFNKFKRQFLIDLQTQKSQNAQHSIFKTTYEQSDKKPILRISLNKNNLKEDATENELGFETTRMRSMSTEPEQTKLKITLNSNHSNGSANTNGNNIKKIKLQTKRMNSIKYPKKKGNLGVKIPEASITNNKKSKTTKDLTPPPILEDTMINPGQALQEVDNEVYCYCRGPSSGRMIACDDPRCKIEWFHYKCVGVFSEPQGSWYCPDCSKKRAEELVNANNKVKKKKKKRRSGYF